MKQSVGVLVYMTENGRLFVFLVHPCRPFWAKKDIGAWSIPRGELGEGEEPLAAARRKFAEETGQSSGGWADNLPSIFAPMPHPKNESHMRNCQNEPAAHECRVRLWAVHVRGTPRAIA